MSRKHGAPRTICPWCLRTLDSTEEVEEHAKRKHPTNYALTEEYRQEQALREYDLDKRKHMRKLR
jgi:hypothetical protein